MVRDRLAQEVLGVARLGGDLESRLGQQADDPFTQKDVVLTDDYTYRLCHVWRLSLPKGVGPANSTLGFSGLLVHPLSRNTDAMELRHFRYLVCRLLLEKKKRAAERLHVAQPAVSEQIRK